MTHFSWWRHDPFFKVFQGFLEKINSNSRFSTFSRSSKNAVNRCKDFVGAQTNAIVREGGGVLLAVWAGRGRRARAQDGYVTGR